MTSTLFLFASQAEAKPALDACKAKHVDGEYIDVWDEGRVPSLYQCDKGWIGISGIGTYAAQHLVSKLAKEISEVWNLGIAGSLRPLHNLGLLKRIAVVGKYIPLRETLDPKSLECVYGTIPNLSLYPATHGISLISSDFPLHQEHLRDELAKEWDLIDMEGYGVAYAAHRFGKPCFLWKIVSDFASAEGRALIRKHKQKWSERLAEIVINS